MFSDRKVSKRLIFTPFENGRVGTFNILDDELFDAVGVEVCVPEGTAFEEVSFEEIEFEEKRFEELFSDASDSEELPLIVLRVQEHMEINSGAAKIIHKKRKKDLYFIKSHILK